MYETFATVLLSAAEATDAATAPTFNLGVTVLTAAITAVFTALGAWLAVGLTLRGETRKKKAEALVAKRVQIYDAVASAANDILCFCLSVGRWRELTPRSVIAAKHTIDHEMHIYGEIFSPAVRDAWHAFMTTYFEEFSGTSQAAKLRAERAKIEKQWGRRWDRRWASAFSADPPRTRAELRTAYTSLLSAMSADLGV